MATITIKKIQQLDYREGFDVTVEMISDPDLPEYPNGRVGYKTFFVMGKDKPTQKTLQIKLDKFIADFNILPVIDRYYTRSEIDEILVQKKYFTKDNKFPGDLPIKVVV